MSGHRGSALGSALDGPYHSSDCGSGGRDRDCAAEDDAPYGRGFGPYCDLDYGSERLGLALGDDSARGCGSGQVFLSPD